MSEKALFLVKSAKTPSSRIRICELAPYLADHDIEYEIEYIPKNLFSRLKLLKKAADFDLVMFQKRLLPNLEFRELRRNAKILGFDFDDAVFHKNASPSANYKDYISPTRERRFTRIIKNIDFAIAANSYLASKTAEFAPDTKIEILPSSVDTDTLEHKEDYTLSEPPSAGWVGTQVTHRFLEYLAPAFRELRRKTDFELRVISDKDLLLEGLNVKNIRWSRETENCEIRRFDIGIMPLSDDPYARGKASYKLLQYMAAGVPSIASAVGMNREVAGSNEFALLAESADEFPAAMEKLFADIALRKKLGKNGRKKIEREFSRDIVGHRFAEIIASRIK